MKFAVLALTAALATAAGVEASMAQEGVVLLHPLMKDIAAPQAQVLWDVGNRGMDDDGNPSAKNLKPADWTKLALAAELMKGAATKLADAPKVAVGAPGTKLQDEDAPGAKTAVQIQDFIDADPKGFAEHARLLATVSDEFAVAAKARDVVKLQAASGRLDEICEGCHTKYWYPDEAASAQ